MNFGLLREYIQAILSEAQMFEEWLSPDVVRLLIDEYSQRGGTLGVLDWEYVETLGARTWGQYLPRAKRLLVSNKKTEGLFKQQVQTILHEIQHWNQHVKIAASNSGIDPGRAFERVYQGQRDSYGYWKCPMEVDARAFADLHLEEAMGKISKHYGGKLEGGSIDGVVEELVDEFLEDERPLGRGKIGALLRDYDLNSMENLKLVIAKLVDLGVKVS
jgi:hypothetical protein